MGHRVPVAVPRSVVSAWLSVLLAAVVSSPAGAQIRINEILANPDGDDTGQERVEIYNAGTTAVDVTGWAIDDAATFDQTAVRARLPEDFDTASGCSGSAIIQPGEFRVIKGQSTAPYLNNTGDTVYLISNRTSVPPPVVHQVTYGSAPSGQVWAAVPDGSSNFDWRTPSMCATNGGAGDVTPPSAVADLTAVAGSFPGEVRLNWTAPGDDGMAGTASEYRIKVAYSPINAGNFNAAADLERWVNEPLPAVGGSAEQWTVFGLSPDSTYYFALVAVDDASNVGGVSNSPSSAPAAGSLLNPNLGYSTYFGNLHSHTSYSDGNLTPADAYFYARFTAPTPLDFMAVTDHNHSSAGMQRPNYHNGLSQAAAANADGQFVAIYGQEWGFAANGHVNIYESPKLFGWETNNYDVLVAEGDYPSLYTAMRNNPPASYPVIGSFCHPGASDFSNLLVTSDGQEVMRLMALVNGPANSSATDESDVGNTNYDAVFQSALRKGYRVSPTADQDNHNSNWGSSSQSRTAVLATQKTKSAILEAMHQRRAYATMDHNAVVEFSADGQPMGAAFLAPAGVRIAARVTDPDPGAPAAKIEIFRGVTGSSTATRVAFNENNPELHWRELTTFPTGTEVHYYLKISKPDGRSIWTGPVYVTYDPSIVVSVDEETLGRGLALAAPRPNPARGPVQLRFTLPRGSERASLRVFDLSGRLVRTVFDGALGAGEHTAAWDGLDDGGARSGAGVYFIRLDNGRESTGRKVVLF